MISSAIILDTNVLSEMSRAQPDPSVRAWYLRQESTHLYTTAITKAEVFYGIDLMPHGQRRRQLTQLSLIIFEEDLKDKILPFDQMAARSYAQLRSSRQREGRPIASLDAQIAAIALTAYATLATRNTTDFEHCGVTLVNPWLL